MEKQALKRLEKREAKKKNKEKLIKMAVYAIPFGGSTLGSIKSEIKGNKGLHVFGFLNTSLDFRLNELKKLAAPWVEPV